MYTKQEIIIRSYREGKSQRRISRELSISNQEDDGGMKREKVKNRKKHFDFLSGISPKGNQNALHN